MNDRDSDHEVPHDETSSERHTSNIQDIKGLPVLTDDVGPEILIYSRANDAKNQATDIGYEPYLPTICGAWPL